MEHRQSCNRKNYNISTLLDTKRVLDAETPASNTPKLHELTEADYSISDHRSMVFLHDHRTAHSVEHYTDHLRVRGNHYPSQ